MDLTVLHDESLAWLELSDSPGDISSHQTRPLASSLLVHTETGHQVIGHGAQGLGLRARLDVGLG